MKKMRKLLSIVMAAAMALTLTVTASAVTGESPETKGSITVKNAVDNVTYKIYRIFDLKSYDTDKNAYKYEVNEDWKGFFEEGKAGAEYVEINEGGYVTWVDGKSAANFAAAAKEYVDTKKITEVDSGKKVAGQALKFENLELGYYLMVSDLKNDAICSLDTTDPDVEIEEKNADSSLVKKVWNGTNWVDANDADIGDTITYQVTVTVREGEPEGYEIHDTMGSGLTYLPSELVVKINGIEIAEGAPATEGAKAWENINPDAGETFALKFYNLEVNDVITVEYKAVLNENAFVGGEADTNKNSASLKINGKPGPDDETDTYTWKFGVHKVGVDDDATTADINLDGVKFKLHADTADGAVIAFDKLEDGVYQVCQDANCENTTHTTEVFTADGGKLTLKGLDSGTYYLEEAETLPGYNGLEASIKVEIDDEGAVKFDGEADDDKVVEVENLTGNRLPETGGMGTTLFTVGGAGLMVLAVVLLVTKKKMSSR